jgi:hypothetical protein
MDAFTRGERLLLRDPHFFLAIASRREARVVDDDARTFYNTAGLGE